MKRSKTNRKLITDEMADRLSLQQLYDLRMQGWEFEHPPVPDKQDRAHDQQSTYFGRVGLRQGPTSPEENDPDLQQLANRLGVTSKDLVLFRELLLECYGDRYSEEKHSTPEGSEE